ncbi:hypothetical protein BOTBODRAFT_111451 [Botryobasidium botryosum FD-172 SS1]|uniref:Uncharacterized protein n=1 Tax=Botryobasidium botryosum (strain FD-172 SS1) TaxID=930990 RepID=A0A067MD75_BOTB1|nr:hypothetical protein BOTBODRAFT_111451 [Botryobasidium botryosum FD-172 SS1]
MPDTPEPPKPSNSKKNDSKNKGKSQNVRSSSKKDKPTVPRPRPKMTKLAPPRPFPTVSLSSNATGPYSARAEGKNNICVTRRSPLGMYLRRCAALVNDDGYRTLDFYALGAAIPHLLLLTTSLPRILPFPADEIVSSIHTGTVKCVDEMLPGDDEEEEEGENTLRERDKSCLRVTMKIGDGVRVSGRKGAPIQNKAKKLQTAGTGTGKEKGKGKRAAKAALDDIPDAPDDDGMVE